MIRRSRRQTQRPALTLAQTNDTWTRGRGEAPLPILFASCRGLGLVAVGSCVSPWALSVPRLRWFRWSFLLTRCWFFPPSPRLVLVSLVLSVGSIGVGSPLRPALFFFSPSVGPPYFPFGQRLLLVGHCRKLDPRLNNASRIPPTERGRRARGARIGPLL